MVRVAAFEQKEAFVAFISKMLPSIYRKNIWIFFENKSEQIRQLCFSLKTPVACRHCSTSYEFNLTAISSQPWYTFCCVGTQISGHVNVYSF